MYEADIGNEEPEEQLVNQGIVDKQPVEEQKVSHQVEAPPVGVPPVSTVTVSKAMQDPEEARGDGGSGGIGSGLDNEEDDLPKK